MTHWCTFCAERHVCLEVLPIFMSVRFMYYRYLYYVGDDMGGTMELWSSGGRDASVIFGYWWPPNCMFRFVIFDGRRDWADLAAARRI